MKLKFYLLAGFISAFLCASETQAQTKCALMPLSHIEVVSEGLTYDNIAIHTAVQNMLHSNHLPQNLPVSFVTQNPAGFEDSAGWVFFGMSFTLLQDTNMIAHTDDIYENQGQNPDTILSDLTLNNNFDTNLKSGQWYTVKARIFDRKGKGYIAYRYHFLLVPPLEDDAIASQASFNIDTRGLHYGNIGWSNSSVAIRNLEFASPGKAFEFKAGDTARLVFLNIDGFGEESEMETIHVDFEMADADGTPFPLHENVPTGKTSWEKAAYGLTVYSDIQLPKDLEPGKRYFLLVRLNADGIPNVAEAVLSFTAVK